MRTMILAGGLLLALSGSTLAAPVYKWIDAQGVTHFSAQPPAGQAVEIVGTASASRWPASGEPPVDDLAAAPVAEPDQEAIDRKVRQQVAAQEAQRQKHCEALRTNLAQLRHNPRVQVEEDGKVRRLPEEERQARISETEQRIAGHCQ